MKKTRFVACLIVALMAVTSVLWACKKDTPEQKPTPNQGSPTIKVDVTEFSLPRLESRKLSAEVKDVDGVIINEPLIIWSSSNPDTASVDEHGLVKAWSEGNVTITAKYGSISANAKLTVTEAVRIPALHVGAGDGSRFDVMRGGTFEPDPVITFDGVVQADATFTMSKIGDEAGAIFTINDGVITGVSEGEAQLYVEGSWRGFTSTHGLSSRLTVRVLRDLTVGVNPAVGDSSLIMYAGNDTATIFAGTEYQEMKNSDTLQAMIVDEGIDITTDFTDTIFDGRTIEWNSTDESVVSILGTGTNNSECVITGLKQGVAEIWFVSKHPTDSDEDIISPSRRIEVILPVLDKTQEGTNSLNGDDIDSYALSQNDAAYAFTSVSAIGADVEVSEIFDVTGTLNQKIIGSSTGAGSGYGFNISKQTTNLGYGERVWKLRLSLGYEVTIKVFVYTEIIKSADRLAGFRMSSSGAQYGVNTHYALGNNIDATSYKHANNGGYNTLNLGAGGFQGEFDGRGFTIHGMTVGTSGFFGGLGGNSVVKNLGITAVTIKAGSYSPSLFANAMGGNARLENIFGTVKKIDGSLDNVSLVTVLTYGTGKVSLKNIVLEVCPEDNFAGLGVNASSVPHKVGSFMQEYQSGNYPATENVHIISDRHLFNGKGTPSDTTARAVDGVFRYGSGARELSELTMSGIDNETGYWSVGPDGYPAFTTYRKMLKIDVENALSSLQNVEYSALTGGTLSIPAGAGEVTISEVTAFGAANNYSITQGLNAKIEILVNAGGGDYQFLIESDEYTDVTKTITISVKAEVFLTAGTYFELARKDMSTIGGSAESYKELTFDASESGITGFNAVDGWKLAWSKDNGTTYTDLADEHFTFSDGKIKVLGSAFKSRIAAPADVLPYDGDGPIKPGSTYFKAYRAAITGELPVTVTFTNVTVLANVITEATELEVFKYYKDSGLYGVDEKYILGRNIDATAYTHSSHAHWRAGFGFRGIFDGRGFTINGITVQNGGFFGMISENAVVKNIAFTNVTISVNSWQASVLAINVTGNTTIDNVFVSVKAVTNIVNNDTGTNNNAAFSLINTISGVGTVKIKNTVVVMNLADYSEITTKKAAIGSFLQKYDAYSNYATTENMHVISDIGLFFAAVNATSGGNLTAAKDTTGRAYTGLTRYGTGATAVGSFDMTGFGNPEDMWLEGADGYAVFKTAVGYLTP